jgi:3-dehydroquinate dehydratase-1
VKIVVSVPDLSTLEHAVASGADAIEIRLDLLEYSECTRAHQALSTGSVPLIVTLRTDAEGGAFRGTPDEWRKCLEPWLDIADYVDIERPFAAHTDEVRNCGASVIASNHRHDMPDQTALRALEAELRGYGDIPKIIVAPSSMDDALRLLSFTAMAEKPIATGVMGAEFRFMRAILPLFGSELVFCHTGIPTSPGQYHIDEMRRLLEMLR